MMRSPKITTDELVREQNSAVRALQAIKDALDKSKVETVPDGWMTSPQMAQMAGQAVSVTRELIRKGVQRGIVERRTFNVRTMGGVKPIPYYRLTEKPKGKR